MNSAETTAVWSRTRRFMILIPACVMLVVVAACASSQNTTTTPPTTMPLTTTAAAPTTTLPVTTTVVDAEQAVGAVLVAIDSYNSGDIDRWVAAFDPESSEAPEAETWGYFDEIFMNANRQYEVVEPCQLVASDPGVVECTLAMFDDFHGPAGISGTAPAQFRLNDQLKLSGFDDNQDCCDRQFAYTRAFNNWLRDIHADVYEQIKPSDIGSLPGWRTDPADMAIAIQYVAEFIAQSDTYPLEVVDP